MQDRNSEIISASELGQFNYCSVSWYLQKSGYKPISPKIEIGKNKHKKIGNIIDKTQVNQKRVKNLLIIGYLFLIFGILFIAFEVLL